MKFYFIILFSVLLLSCGKENVDKSDSTIGEEEASSLVYQIEEKKEENTNIRSKLLKELGVSFQALDSETSFQKVLKDREQLKDQLKVTELSKMLNLLQNYIENGKFIYQKVDFLKSKGISESGVTSTELNIIYASTNFAVDLYNKVKPYQEKLKSLLEEEKTEEERKLKEEHDRLTKAVRELFAEEQTAEFQVKSLEERAKMLNEIQAYAIDEHADFEKFKQVTENKITEIDKKITHLERNILAEYWNRSEVSELKVEKKQLGDELKKREAHHLSTSERSKAIEFAREQLRKDESDFQADTYQKTTTANIMSVTLGDVLKYRNTDKSSLVVHLVFDSETYDKLSGRFLLSGDSSLEESEGVCSYEVPLEKELALKIRLTSQMNKFFLDRSQLTFITADEVKTLQYAIRGIENFGCSVITK